MTEIEIGISGKAFSTIEGSEIYYDPKKYDGGSKGARDAYTALNDASWRRQGRGWLYTVRTTPEGAATIEGYCRAVGDTFASETEPETRAEGRALLKVADKLREKLSTLNETSI